MLKSLYISSFIIIEKMNIEFDESMNVLTGETGSGKSIIIDAIGQLCGNRSSLSYIKKDADKAVIEGVFDVQMTSNLEKICEELHIDIDDQFVITKEILNTGKSNIKINYHSASNNALKLLMPYLIDIHSQFETQKIFTVKNHMALLDEYSKNDLEKIKTRFNNEYENYKKLKNELSFFENENDSDEQLDFLQSQLNEIEEISYTDSDVEELEEEFKKLDEYSHTYNYIKEFDQCINANNGMLDKFKEGLNYLEQVSHYDCYKDKYDLLYNEYYNFVDIYEEIMQIHKNQYFDEYRFAELKDTLTKINRLKKKYGYCMKNINQKKDELISQIDIIENRENIIEDLKKQINTKFQEVYHIAQDISNIRKKQALKFEKEIENELSQLCLNQARFKIQIQPCELNNTGIDNITFMIATNKGQNLTLLTETASGGEISRIMLAIKIIILSHSSLETIIFDEVDTGVSGKIASSIGERMNLLSKNKQVICITHLPQVACYAHTHYSIVKDSNQINTISSIKKLNVNERILEIAKMLSGEKITNEAIENAKQLLNV